MFTSKSLRILVGVLLVLGFAVLLVFSYGGELARDIVLSHQTLVPHPTARLLNAKCTNHYLLVSTCSVEYDDPAVAKPADKIQVKSELSYLMFGSIRGERVVLMRPVNSRVVTSSTGILHLTNRIVTLLILAGFCVVMPLLTAFKLFTRGAGTPADADRSLTADPMDAAIAKRMLAQAPPPASASMAPPAYQSGAPGRAAFGQRRFSR